MMGWVLTMFVLLLMVICYDLIERLKKKSCRSNGINSKEILDYLYANRYDMTDKMNQELDELIKGNEK